MYVWHIRYRFCLPASNWSRSPVRNVSHVSIQFDDMLCITAFEPTVRHRDYFVSLVTHKDSVGSNFDENSCSWFRTRWPVMTALVLAFRHPCLRHLRIYCLCLAVVTMLSTVTGLRLTTSTANGCQWWWWQQDSCYKSKWLKVLWMKIDFMDDDRRRRTGQEYRDGSGDDKWSIRRNSHHFTTIPYVADDCYGNEVLFS